MRHALSNGGGALVFKLRLDLGFAMTADVRVRLVRQGGAAFSPRAQSPALRPLVSAWTGNHGPLAVRTQKPSRTAVAAGDSWLGVVFCDTCGATLNESLSNTRLVGDLRGCAPAAPGGEA